MPETVEQVKIHTFNLFALLPPSGRLDDFATKTFKYHDTFLHLQNYHGMAVWANYKAIFKTLMQLDEGKPGTTRFKTSY